MDVYEDRICASDFILRNLELGAFEGLPSQGSG